MTPPTSPSPPIRRFILGDRSPARDRQRTLFCGCGQGTPGVAGLCRRCYRARAHSRAKFAGNRDSVLERDARRCRTCGAGNRLHVHHRQPGQHAASLLVTLCASCHARLHRLASIRRWVPEPLIPLWAEQHMGTPIQLQFPLAEIVVTGFAVPA